MKKNIKKIIGISGISLLLMQIIYVFSVEPEIATAATATDSVIVTLTVDSGISITTPADVTMAPNISMSANGSIGSATWNVKTNNTLGYTLAVKASASPALVSGSNNFADYTETTPGTAELWSVPASNKEFGFSARGTKVNTTTYGTGADCGSAGNPNATLKYIGFETIDRSIASSTTFTTTAGEDTILCMAAEQDGVYAASGVYTATITATATTL